MAAGGGLYLTAVFATVIILIALVVLGRMEAAFSLKTFVTTYEVTGRNVDGMLREVNRILDAEQLTMQSVHIATADPDFRMVFAVDCEREQQSVFSIRLHESNVFGHRDSRWGLRSTNERATNERQQRKSLSPRRRPAATIFCWSKARTLPAILALLTRRMCDRHRGVGADGVEWLFPDAEADVERAPDQRRWSEAEISGNGTRCVAAEFVRARAKRKSWCAPALD